MAQAITSHQQSVEIDLDTIGLEMVEISSELRKDDQ